MTDDDTGIDVPFLREFKARGGGKCLKRRTSREQSENSRSPVSDGEVNKEMAVAKLKSGKMFWEFFFALNVLHQKVFVVFFICFGQNRAKGIA